MLHEGEVAKCRVTIVPGPTRRALTPFERRNSCTEDERLAGGGGLTDQGRGEILRAVERLAKSRASQMSDTDALARSMRRLAGASIRASEAGNARLLLGVGADRLLSDGEASQLVAAARLGHDPDANALSVAAFLRSLGRDAATSGNSTAGLPQTETGE